MPVDVQLVFGSTVTAAYNTTLTGPVQYIWGVDGVNAGSTPTITHTFARPGTYSVSLSVLNAGSHVALSSLPVIVLGKSTLCVVCLSLVSVSSHLC